MRVWLQLVHNLCVKQPQFSSKAFDQLRAFLLTSLTSCDLKTANVAGAIILQAIINGGCSIIGDPLEVVDGLLGALQIASGEGSQSCEFPYLALLKLVGSIEVEGLPSKQLLQFRIKISLPKLPINSCSITPWTNWRPSFQTTTECLCTKWFVKMARSSPRMTSDSSLHNSSGEQRVFSLQ